MKNPKKEAGNEGRVMSLNYIYDEFCIAAAFLKIPCIYGIPSGSLQTRPRRWSNKLVVSEIERAENAAIHLNGRVKDLVALMEKKGLLLIDADGKVSMQNELFDLLSVINDADKIGRMSAVKENQIRRVFLYRNGGRTVIQKPDQKGGGEFHILENGEELIPVLKELFKDGDYKLITALLFQKKGIFYETYLDQSWNEDKDLSDALKEMTSRLEG